MRLGLKPGLRINHGLRLGLKTGSRINVQPRRRYKARKKVKANRGNKTTRRPKSANSLRKGKGIARKGRAGDRS